LLHIDVKARAQPTSAVELLHIDVKARAQPTSGWRRATGAMKCKRTKTEPFIRALLVGSDDTLYAPTANGTRRC
jgi:hypothetical protein